MKPSRRQSEHSLALIRTHVFEQVRMSVDHENQYSPGLPNAPFDVINESHDATGESKPRKGHAGADDRVGAWHPVMPEGSRRLDGDRTVPQYVGKSLVDDDPFFCFEIVEFDPLS